MHADPPDAAPRPTIRPAHRDDLTLLDRHLPPTDVPTGHRDRIRAQEQGDADYLVAWLDDRPVGHALIRWSGFKLGPLPALFPGIPILLTMRVWPRQTWGRGIGTARVAAAEQLVAERGRRGLGLGVEVENTRARGLYEHLGYVDWGGGPLREEVPRIDADGSVAAYTEIFTVMTKDFDHRRA
jgi:GNAT superfamily N-acetyltransferase